MTDARRQLPSVERILAELRLGNETSGNAAIPVVHLTASARAVLAKARETGPGAATPKLDQLVELARADAISRAQPSLRRVINATGVILQTNLGRAPLSHRAIEAMERVASGYSNLEFDLDAGERGSRHEHLRDLICAATGAEDALVVNNNAAALLMALQVLAAGREVIISRGQAVEIGGGFRIPDVLRQSGAVLAEIGTTNRTYARDYEAAWTAETAAILRVHSSNFKVVGFTAEASLAEMADVAHRHGGILLDDLGSGCLVDTRRFGLEPEPTVQESLRVGADLALFSGDKLLGGPQCGIIAGRATLVETLRRHPLARALRVDKLNIAALDATLRSYVEGHEADDIPIWQMLSLTRVGLKRRARRWASAAGTRGSVTESVSMVGGGSLPGEGVPTWCCAVAPDSPDGLAKALREWSPPVLGRIADGTVLLDPRTVSPGDDRVVAEALSVCVTAI